MTAVQKVVKLDIFTLRISYDRRHALTTDITNRNAIRARKLSGWNNLP